MTVSSSYRIYVQRNFSLQIVMQYIADRQVFVISDTNVAALHLQPFLAQLLTVSKTVQFFILPHGESEKTLVNANAIYTNLLNWGYRKNCLLIGFGGGVVTDMTGFVAATYLRGVDCIHVPTTLLAQVDAAVGGKTAVNHTLGKNMIGTIYFPKLVYNCTQWLQTLPERVYVSGLAEIVKIAAMFDERFFSWIVENLSAIKARDESITARLIEKSCRLKFAVTQADPAEKSGRRVLLNFGHTFGHAIEVIQNYRGLMHGEAVSIGMMLSATLSYQLKLCESQTVKQLHHVLAALNLPVALPKTVTVQSLLEAMVRDKKNVTKGISLILLSKIGQGCLKIMDSTACIETLLNDSLITIP